MKVLKITYESPNSNYCTQMKIASTTIIPQLKKGFFKILNPLGVTEIYFGVFDEFGNGKKIKYKWRNVLKEISNTTHFNVKSLDD